MLALTVLASAADCDASCQQLVDALDDRYGAVRVEEPGGRSHVLALVAVPGTETANTAAPGLPRVAVDVRVLLDGEELGVAPVTLVPDGRGGALASGHAVLFEGRSYIGRETVHFSAWNRQFEQTTRDLPPTAGWSVHLTAERVRTARQQRRIGQPLGQPWMHRRGLMRFEAPCRSPESEEPAWMPCSIPLDGASPSHPGVVALLRGLGDPAADVALDPASPVAVNLTVRPMDESAVGSVVWAEGRRWTRVHAAFAVTSGDGRARGALTGRLESWHPDGLPYLLNGTVTIDGVPFEMGCRPTEPWPMEGDPAPAPSGPLQCRLRAEEPVRERGRWRPVPGRSSAYGSY